MVEGEFNRVIVLIALCLADHSSVSRLHLSGRRRPQRRRRHRVPPAMSRTSSFSSITDSTMSLNIITVTLNMDTVNFLGISIVGQSNKGGDGGIYVGSIMKGWILLFSFVENIISLFKPIGNYMPCAVTLKQLFVLATASCGSRSKHWLFTQTSLTEWSLYWTWTVFSESYKPKFYM